METYHGHVKSPTDAIILFEACRLGLLPRVQRRLSDKERQSIKSGSVFVWDEREAGMRRWTDGKSWSASRVSGSFLTYREMEGKRGGASFTGPGNATMARRKSPGNGSDSEDDGGMGEDGPDGYRYKPDGLMKQSFSITTSNNQKLHLISYFARSHAASGLNQPSSDPQLKHIRPAPGMYPESTVHEQQNVPVVTQRPMMTAGAQFSPSQSLSPSLQNGNLMNGATHPHSYASPPGQHAAPYNNWPPSPVSTPPVNFPQPSGFGSSSSLPLPPSHRQVTSQPSLSPTFPGQFDRQPDLPAPHLGSPMQLHRPSLASVDTLHSTLQPPSVVAANEPTRFSSPATSAGGSYVTRSPSRTLEQWDPPSLPSVEGSTSPGSRSLDVQDIPSEKLGFREDMRALRQLDRAFIH